MVIYCECRAFVKIVITDDLQGRISQYKKSIIFFGWVTAAFVVSWISDLVVWVFRSWVSFVFFSKNTLQKLFSFNIMRFILKRNAHSNSLDIHLLITLSWSG